MKSWDKFDEEAEREANAIKSSIKVHGPQGKRITKQRRMHRAAATLVQNAACRNHLTTVAQSRLEY